MFAKRRTTVSVAHDTKWKPDSEHYIVKQVAPPHFPTSLVQDVPGAGDPPAPDLHRQHRRHRGGGELEKLWEKGQEHKDNIS